MTINLRVISALLATVLLFVAFAMAIPASYGFMTVSKGSAEFLMSAIIVICLSLLFRHFGKRNCSHMTIKEMFLFTSLVWSIVTLVCALPFILVLKIDVLSACFEAASGLSTTGNTILSDIDALPHTILLWRSMLQCMGGIGFIAVGIAILPNLNIGGMKLFQTESSPQQNSDNVTPKSKTLAKGILLLYIAFLVLAVLTYKCLGMTNFDAVNHALTSVSTGGMSTHADSMGYFSKEIHWATIFFMFVGALPFALMVGAVRGNIRALFKDQQVQGFCIIIIITTLLVTASLMLQESYTFEHAIRISLFNIINILSSTGYTLEDFSGFNHFITLIFLIILPLGACSGSTSGGLKIFRLQIATTLFKRQMHQLMHPNAIFPQRFNNHTVTDTIIRSIITFFTAYMIMWSISALLLAASGLETFDAVTLTLSSLSNIGPAIGPHFGSIGDFTVLTAFQKTVLIIDMIIGRLEVLTIMICFMPSFWKV